MRIQIGDLKDKQATDKALRQMAKDEATINKLATELEEKSSDLGGSFRTLIRELSSWIGDYSIFKSKINNESKYK